MNIALILCGVIITSVLGPFIIFCGTQMIREGLQAGGWL